MIDFFRQLFSTDFTPHFFFLRDPSVIALHEISDSLIALASFIILVILIILIRRHRDLPFRWTYALFGLFILSCEATHILAVVTLWHPVYRLDGLMKAITAIASLSTVVVLVRIMPLPAQLPGPADFRREIEERKRAETEVSD